MIVKSHGDEAVRLAAMPDTKIDAAVSGHAFQPTGSSIGR
jgi:hypothetical protein